MHQKKGFSLIECAVLLVIIGIISSSFFLLRSNEQEGQRKLITQQKLAKIEDALAAYVMFYGKIPCPAEMFNIDNKNFGKSANCFRSVSRRDGHPSVRKGYVPVYELGLSPEYSFDGWKGFFDYATCSYNALSKGYFNNQPINVNQCGGGKFSINNLDNINPIINKNYNLGYGVISFGTGESDVKQWLTDKQKTPKADCNKQKNQNCKPNDEIIDNHQLTGNFVRWQLLEKMQNLAANWSVNAPDQIEKVDHMYLERGKIGRFDVGKYIMKTSKIDKKQEADWAIDLKKIKAGMYIIIELKGTPGSLQANIINNNIKENTIVYRKNHGYYILRKNSVGNVEWHFMGNSTMNNNEIYNTADQMMSGSLWTKDGIYLLPDDANRLNAQHVSCINFQKNDLIMIIENRCYFVGNTHNNLVYIKEEKKFKNLPAGSRSWGDKYKLADK